MGKKRKKEITYIYYVITGGEDSELSLVEIHSLISDPYALKARLSDIWVGDKITEIFTEHDIPSYRLISSVVLEPLQ